VVVVSYNTRDLLRACLQTLAAASAAESTWLDVESVVVDNASSDGSAAMVARDFPAVHLIASGENLGFARANNAALRALGILENLRTDRPDFVWLLNPDTEVAAGAPGTLVRFLLAEAGAAACGPRLLYGDGQLQHGAFGWPGLSQVLLDLVPAGSLPGGARLLASKLNGRYPRALWEGNEPFAVDFVLGAALMARASDLRALGGLDEGYFMYCEEMDWCLRAHKAGRRIFAVPAAVVVHHEGQSSKLVSRATRERLWRSRLRFYAQHADFFGAWMAPTVRALLRLRLRAELHAVRRSFAGGQLTGEQAAEEISACTTLASLSFHDQQGSA